MLGYSSARKAIRSRIRDIFEGNVFEGHTLLPTLDKIRQKYGLERPVVVADAGLLSRDNLKLLVAEGYSFILGARIKNESDASKEKDPQNRPWIKDQQGFNLQRADGNTD